MRGVPAVAARELQSYFVSPVAYVVLTLWSLLAGSFFLSALLGFLASEERARQLAAIGHATQTNLNDGLVAPFFGAMWAVMLFLLPAVTMGLFTSEKSQGTEELLLTSPLTGWDIVLGKFCAGAAFGLILVAVVAFFPGLLFAFGDPEIGKTASGLLALVLSSFAYVAVGAFASSLTRSQLIAFLLTLVILLVLGLLAPFIVEAGALGGRGEGGVLAAVMGWVATGHHTERLLAGLVDTADLAYFALVTAAFLVLTRTAVDSVRWR